MSLPLSLDFVADLSIAYHKPKHYSLIHRLFVHVVYINCTCRCNLIHLDTTWVLWVTNLNGLPHSLLSYGHLIPGERACTGCTCLIKMFFQGPSKGRYIPWAVPEDSGYWLNGVLRWWSANGWELNNQDDSCKHELIRHTGSMIWNHPVRDKVLKPFDGSDSVGWIFDWDQ